MATMLELRKLSSYGYKVTYSASINRQCHTYAVTERRDARSHALHRVFTRSVTSWQAGLSYFVLPAKLRTPSVSS